MPPSDPYEAYLLLAESVGDLSRGVLQVGRSSKRLARVVAADVRSAAVLVAVRAAAVAEAVEAEVNS